MGRIAVSGNFDHQGADRGAEHGFIDEIHDLGALGFGIILEQDRSRSAAVDDADSVKQLPRRLGAQTDRLLRQEASGQEQEGRKKEAFLHLC